SLSTLPPPPPLPLFPYTTLFRSTLPHRSTTKDTKVCVLRVNVLIAVPRCAPPTLRAAARTAGTFRGSSARASGFEECTECRRDRSEEHTSELQSLAYLVCRLLLE